VLPDLMPEQRPVGGGSRLLSALDPVALGDDGVLRVVGRGEAGVEDAPLRGQRAEEQRGPGGPGQRRGTHRRHRPDRAERGQRLARLDVVSALVALLVGLRDHAEPLLHDFGRDQLERRAEHTEGPGRTELAHRDAVVGQPERQAAGRRRTRPGEDERHLAVAAVPGRHRGVGKEYAGVGGHRTTEGRRARGRGRAQRR
jgi:hypothetical protein